MCPVFRGERGEESEKDCTFSLAVMPRRVMLRGARAANRELPTHSPVLWMRWHVCKTHAHTERENTLQWCNIITESTRRQTLQQTWWSNKRKCFWKTAENIGILIWHSWMQTLYKYTITVRHRTTFTILKKKNSSNYFLLKLYWNIKPSSVISFKGQKKKKSGQNDLLKCSTVCNIITVRQQQQHHLKYLLNN